MTGDHDIRNKKTPFISFVVPCYNEAPNLEGAVKEIDRTASECGIDNYEVILVDDAGSDGSGEIMVRLAAEKPYIKHIANPKNLGFGGAYKAGVRHAAGEYVIMVPGDNNHPADGVVPIIRLAGRADMVIPFITNPGVRGLKRQIISRAFTRLMNFLFDLDVPYYNGLVLHRTELLRKITIETDGFAYQAEAVIKLLKGGADYITVGVKLNDADPRTSAFKLKNIYRVIKTVITLKLRIGRDV